LRGLRANAGEPGNRGGPSTMKWHAPKIVEIACGGEINAYFPAEL
jgi:coenzyme PQQ precursor peptide PqqA